MAFFIFIPIKPRKTELVGPNRFAELCELYLANFAVLFAKFGFKKIVKKICHKFNRKELKLNVSYAKNRFGLSEPVFRTM